MASATSRSCGRPHRTPVPPQRPSRIERRHLGRRAHDRPGPRHPKLRAAGARSHAGGARGQGDGPARRAARAPGRVRRARPAARVHAARLHRRRVLAGRAAAALRRLRVRPGHLPAHHDGARRAGARPAAGCSASPRRTTSSSATSTSRGRSSCSATGTSAARCPPSRRRPSASTAATWSTAGGTTRRGATCRRTSSAGAVVTEPTGEIDTRWVAFRRDQFEIIDNWDTLGMRGTGSRRVVVHDLFVPEHHTVPSPNPFRPVVELPGRDVACEPDVSAARWHRCSSPSRRRSCVGIAHAAIDAYIELLATKRQYGPDVAAAVRAGGLPAPARRGDRLRRHGGGDAAPGRPAWTERAERSAETGVPVSDEEERRLHAHRAADHGDCGEGRRPRLPHEWLERDPQGRRPSSAASATSTWSGPTSRCSSSARGRTSVGSGSAFLRRCRSRRLRRPWRPSPRRAPCAGRGALRASRRRACRPRAARP